MKKFLIAGALLAGLSAPALLNRSASAAASRMAYRRLECCGVDWQRGSCIAVFSH